ncbi:BnaC03g73010D [Brassica napus]|uniref:BnaC03g73010D protein n=1 Tax=Brassica napus TaxID=3708 RepID=A0A078IKK1_BRANA|nr:BnaC03g73010D [Brassica napus]
MAMEPSPECASRHGAKGERHFKHRLISKVDEMNSVMAEMMHITAQETVLLKQCEGFLSVAAAMYVKIVAD